MRPTGHLHWNSLFHSGPREVAILGFSYIRLVEEHPVTLISHNGSEETRRFMASRRRSLSRCGARTERQSLPKIPSRASQNLRSNMLERSDSCNPLAHITWEVGLLAEWSRLKWRDNSKQPDKLLHSF